jgi:hypothetical protein
LPNQLSLPAHGTLNGRHIHHGGFLDKPRLCFAVGEGIREEDAMDMSATIWTTRRVRNLVVESV